MYECSLILISQSKKYEAMDKNLVRAGGRVEVCPVWFVVLHLFS